VWVEVIDLRWGLGLEEVNEAMARNRTLSACVAEIDRARPLFVGLSGDRYGWTPSTGRWGRLAVDGGRVGRLDAAAQQLSAHGRDLAQRCLDAKVKRPGFDDCSCVPWVSRVQLA